MGNSTGNTIDINGKRYDAVTGQYLGPSTLASRVHHKAVQIDGFSKRARSMDIAVRPSITAKPAAPKAAHAPASHIRPHQPQRGKTLMRTAVKKPEIIAPSRLKALTRTDVLARVPEQTVPPKVSVAAVDPKRLQKASLASKSPSVSHYASESLLPSVGKNYFDIQTSGDRAALVGTQINPGHGAPHRPADSVGSRHGSKRNIFEQAIEKATSHENTYDGPKSKKRGRLAGVATFTMAILLLAGIVGYMNMPLLSLKLAASRAGVNARLPGYSPAGFTFGNLSYGPGNVTVSYTAGPGSDRKFDITQKVSDWDSQALLTNFVASANKAYQTYERAGRTIYFYGDNTATWVDGGIWYTVNGNNSLSKNQLLDMAGSL